MKKLFSLTVILLFLCLSGLAQEVTLTFAGKNTITNKSVKLSRIEITNQTRNWTETLTYPDTIAVLTDVTSIEENARNNNFGLSQNNPNPFNGTTNVNLNLTEPGMVAIKIVDVNGKTVELKSFTSLQPGTHQFRVNVANAGVYFLTGYQYDKTSSIKMVNHSNGTTNTIEYIGSIKQGFESFQRGTIDKVFTAGDEMTYKGYAMDNGKEVESKTVLQQQLASDSITLFFSIIPIPKVTTDTISDITETSAICGGKIECEDSNSVTARGVCWSTKRNCSLKDNHTTEGRGVGNFTSEITGLKENTTYYIRAYATYSEGTIYGEEKYFTTKEKVYGIPCPGEPTLTDIDGNTYNTVFIGEQCWMKENLKTTKYPDGTEITKWFYPNNDSTLKDTYGLLYTWKMLMGTSASSSANPSNVQGACPDGWHVPSDAEWTQLTNYVGLRGDFRCASNKSHIAKALASTKGWKKYGGADTEIACLPGFFPDSNNVSGFSALPAGNCDGNNYADFSETAYFWTATQTGTPTAYFRSLSYSNAFISRYDEGKFNAYSVRCVKGAVEVKKEDGE